MVSTEKLIKKMRNQPTSIRPEEAEKVLSSLGFTEQRTRGSHKNFYRESDGLHFTLVVNKNPIRRYLVEDILEIYDNKMI